MPSWGRAASSPGMRRPTQSWRVTLRDFYGTSPFNQGHPMSTHNVSTMATGNRTLPFLDPLGCALQRENERPEGSEPHPSPADLLRVAVIGYGYWGPNVVRNFLSLENCQIVAVCDKSPAALRRASRQCPGVNLTTDFAEVLTSAQVDAIAVVTPVWTHFELAKSALRNGKHVFVEKPFTSTTQQAEELIELADRKHLKIMVDHTFLFSGPVAKIRELVDGGILGPLYYFDSTRVNLGLFQHDVNVVWDLAPHDLSIMDHVIAEKAEAVVATGANHLNGHADMAFITVYFPGNIVAHINVNWLSPVKVRMTL